MHCRQFLDAAIAENNSADVRYIAFQSYLTAPFLYRQVNELEYSFTGKIICDAGTGIGILPHILREKNPLKIIGLDLDADSLKTASSIGGCQNTFYVNADVRNMPFKTETFDAVFVRYVFQHTNLSNPFLSEIKRTLKYGGLLIIIDIEDDMTLHYPETTVNSRKLFNAYSRYQAIEGGDRNISKKLPSFLSSGGFCDIKIKPFTQTFFKRKNDYGSTVQIKNAFLLLQNEFESIKKNLFEKKLITPSEYHIGLNDYYKFLNSEKEDILVSKTDFLIACVKK
ncbi:MAG: class I SAM-dependent methyltransferase [Candidatus Acidulodesulfobacterium sp.]